MQDELEDAKDQQERLRNEAIQVDNVLEAVKTEKQSARDAAWSEIKKLGDEIKSLKEKLMNANADEDQVKTFEMVLGQIKSETDKLQNQLLNKDT